MSLYRVKQFWAVFSRINKEDKIYIQTYLDKDEQQFFLSCLFRSRSIVLGWLKSLKEEVRWIRVKKL